MDIPTLLTAKHSLPLISHFNSFIPLSQILYLYCLLYCKMLIVTETVTWKRIWSIGPWIWRQRDQCQGLSSLWGISSYQRVRRWVKQIFEINSLILISDFPFGSKEMRDRYVHTTKQICIDIHEFIDWIWLLDIYSIECVFAFFLSVFFLFDLMEW